MLDPAQSPCGAFVESGSSVFVPKGETLESMQVVENVVSNLDVAGTQNEFAGWLLSASFDSAGCYRAVGEFMCASLFRPCSSDVVSSSTDDDDDDGDGSRCLEDQAVPVPLCEQACVLSAERRLQQCQEVVNSRGLLPPQVLVNGSFVDVDYTRTCRTRISVFDERKSSFGNAAEVLGTRYFRDLARFGTKLYSEEAGTCPQTEFFSRTEALQFVTSCPRPFVVNQAVFGEGVAKNERDRFCVVPCPSFVYTEGEYRSMWGGYICIGLLALALNFVAA